jgi:hypothetical protein
LQRYCPAFPFCASTAEDEFEADAEEDDVDEEWLWLCLRNALSTCRNVDDRLSSFCTKSDDPDVLEDDEEEEEDETDDEDELALLFCDADGTLVKDVSDTCRSAFCDSRLENIPLWLKPLVILPFICDNRPLINDGVFNSASARAVV